MENVFVIDLPSLCIGKKVGMYNHFVSLILSKLGSIKSSKLLFRNNVWAIFEHTKSYEYNLILPKIASIAKRAYEDMDDSDRIQTQPKLTEDQFSSLINEEILLQAMVMHCYDGGQESYRYISFPNRWNSDSQVLITKLNDKQLEHIAIICSDLKDIECFIAKFRPKLDQQKHGKREWKNDGDQVSPFSSYDEKHPEAAQKLLQQAFDDYIPQGKEDYFPKRLYTWDKTKKVYVEFRRSLEDGSYHGFDQQDIQRVPDYIKEKYLHKF